MCDVLVLPSDDRLESFGIVQVEAMLNGCPVVATDLPGVRVPIEKTGMGLVIKPGDSRILAKALITVVTKKSKFVKNLKTIGKIFNFESTIQAYEKLFKN
jgi:glycosyltransferase involved in cell wall biosynthesis